MADRLGEALDTEYQVLTVRRMESGKRGFSAAEVVAVADLLGVTTDALLGHEQVADARAEAKAVSDFLHRQIRLLQGTRQLVQQAGLDGTPTAEVPFRSLEEVLGDGPEA